MLLGVWAVVLTAVVVFSAAGQDVLPSRAKLSSQGKKVSTVFDTAFADAKEAGTIHVEVKGNLDNSMPSCFRNRKTNKITRPELLRPAAKILSDGQRPLRILHIGDSHVAGEDFPKAVKATLTSHLGAAESSDEGTGIWFRFIGSNGATTNRFLTESYMNRFSSHRPDLIILSFGTNEAHGMGYREDQHEKDLDKFLTALQKACPEATILLTTPPGDYLGTRAGSRSRARRATKENPMSSRCAAFLENYGKSHNLPVWDLFTICGGKEAAQRNWVTAGLMQKDRIHFQPEGYTLHGRLLGNAIISALSGEEP